MIKFLQVTQTLLVTKVQEVNGVKLFTLATPDGRSFNEELKNSLLGTTSAIPVLQKAKGFIFIEKKRLV